MSILRRWQLTLDQWVSNFLMLWIFETALRVAEALNPKILSIATSWLSFCYYYELQMLWKIEVFQRGQEPQVNNSCFRSMLSRKGKLVETRGRYPMLKDQEMQSSWGDLESSMFWRSLEWLEEELLKKRDLSVFLCLPTWTQANFSIDWTVHILSEQSLSSKSENVQNYKISLGWYSFTFFWPLSPSPFIFLQDWGCNGICYASHEGARHEKSYKTILIYFLSQSSRWVECWIRS